MGSEASLGTRAPVTTVSEASDDHADLQSGRLSSATSGLRSGIWFTRLARADHQLLPKVLDIRYCCRGSATSPFTGGYEGGSAGPSERPLASRLTVLPQGGPLLANDARTNPITSETGSCSTHRERPPERRTARAAMTEAARGRRLASATRRPTGSTVLSTRLSNIDTISP